MAELLPPFRKTFFLNWCPQKWEERFLALTPLQQKALIAAREKGVPIQFAYKAILRLEEDDLLLRFDANILSIWIDHLDNIFVS